eukprot:TRINITY_DN2339_c0_g2_i1.p2 TRINITY_DN2339_c0_g2~~TRINITY_DN2339_c0_g2_i1.p2  ORF type:complete len:315 (-),score=183.69 TRINITY_DN2339_c0_g2_i1:45-989(-)
MENFALWTLAGIGGLVAVRFSFKILGSLLAGLFYSVNLRKLGAKNGGWAVVTGASDGIGKSYAVELAKRGFNIFLISRTQAKLESVAAEIEAAYKVKTEVLAIDFQNAGKEEFDLIGERLGSLEKIGVLVNNVGVNYEFPARFGDASNEEDDKLIHVNITVTNHMTKLVLPSMINAKAGAIINLSSMAGVVPTPMLAVYSGTKAYLDAFSQALAVEYAGVGITAQSVTPGLVVSNMSKVRKANLMTCDPRVITSKSIDCLGSKIQISPYWFHTFLITAQLALPARFRLNQLLKYNEGIRKRALRKIELQSKRQQ